MDVVQYRRGRFIGSGASGDVYEGVDTATETVVAIKCVDCRRFRSIAELEAAQGEVALLGTLRHRHIVRLLDVQFTPDTIYFVMEHASGGTLAQLLKRQAGGCLTEAEALRIFAQIFQAVELCHRRCVVHRDLKPENVLLDAQGDVKVADFGLASILTPFDGGVSSLVGTPEFMAPDLLVTTSCNGAQADVWSLGVMLYECLAGHTPFTGPNLPTILRAGLRGECKPLPSDVSEECRGLVAALLQPDPLKRITLEQVLEHPWVRPALRQLSRLPSIGEDSSEGLVDRADSADTPASDDEEASDGSSTSGQHKPGRSGAERNLSVRGFRSSPGSLDISLPCQRASSLCLSFPGLAEEAGEERKTSGTGLSSIAPQGSSGSAAGSKGDARSCPSPQSRAMQDGVSLLRRSPQLQHPGSAPPASRHARALRSKSFCVPASSVIMLEASASVGPKIAAHPGQQSPLACKHR